MIMKRAIAILMITTLGLASLAGCTGDEANLEETISELEQQAMIDEETRANLNATIASMEATIAQLNTDITTLHAQITDLDSQISDYKSQVSLLNQQNTTKDLQIDLILAQLSILNSTKASLESQVSALENEKSELEIEVSSLNAANQISSSNLLDLQELASELNATIEQLQNTISEMESDDSSGNPTSTLDTIISRGWMKCGVKESQYGMGYLDSATGVRSGLDISYCRALAAAIGLDPDTDVEYILASGSNRFQMLASGTIDVLIRTTTWTATRDASLDADYAGVNFYDGQGMMVRSDAFAYGNGSLHQLENANICVGIGTTSEGNLLGWFETHGITIYPVAVNDVWEAQQKFRDGECDAWTGDTSALVATKWQMDNDEDWADSDTHSEVWIGAEQMSKEPLAAVTRDYDSEWNEIVSWVWYGMITAEELGVTSENYGTIDYSCNSGDSNYNIWLCRLLTQNFGLGTTNNPLPGTWMEDVLATAGNYGEAYDEAFCAGDYDGHSGSAAMNDCLISRAGTLNALVSEGGIQYAPSMR
jgi:general L-amino acid transport system substrate-binding protein